MGSLMTLDEVLAAPDAIVEIRRDGAMEWHLGMILSTEVGSRGTVTIGIEGNFPVFRAEDYGTRWRCWSYDGNIREMENTPWETEKEERDP